MTLHTCGEVKKHAEEKIADIDRKIHTLRERKDALAKRVPPSRRRKRNRPLTAT